MGQIIRGVLGAGSWGFCVLAALAAVACGSSDNSSSKACGTQLAPDEFTVSNVAPARGASVPNSGIVQTFTIVGELVQLTPSAGTAATHTAGDAIPNPVQWTVTASASGKDAVYTSEPITWTTAPGHVELDIGGVFQNTTNGCVSEFPSPMFSYDITAP